MARIAVAGLINIETTLKVEGFPVEYAAVRYPFFGVNSSISGVGYNVCKALITLGHEPQFMSLIGQDDAARLVAGELSALGVAQRGVLPLLDHTPQSVILYDPSGRRAIFTDLKDIQERTYPSDTANALLDGAALAVMGNINFSRPLLAMAQARHIPIATDVHAIGDLHDAYNRDYMAAATLLFQSHEHLPCAPGDWIARLWETYQTPISVVGLGADGALLGLYEGRQRVHVPAVISRPVVSTIGAGDALFSAFLHTYLETGDPLAALRRAVVFASYKIGVAGAADGFLDAHGLSVLCSKHGV